MRIKFPEPVSFQPDHPVNWRDKVRALRDQIAGDKLAWAQERRNTIAAHIAPDGPIKPRQAKLGNISMYDHLAGLVQQLDTDPEGEAGKWMARLDVDVARIEQSLMAEVRW